MKSVDIKQVHLRCLKIAIVFDKICQKYNIPYYMLGGTMLGAIRHKGFIPWDDDMDFGVPRQHYKVLLEILERELPQSYRLITPFNGLVYYDMSKIEDLSTEIIEEGMTDQYRGVYIDIFPLDYGNSNWGIMSKNWWVKHMMGLNIYKRFWPKSLKERIVAVFVRCFPPNFFLKLAYRMIDHEGEFMINYGGFWGEKEIVQKDIFGSPVNYPFEDYSFMGVSIPSAYLSHLYGDYMKMPPEDKRHTHILSFKIK